MDMMGKIQRLHYRGGLSIKEICRRTGLARNTVRYWLRRLWVAAADERKGRETTILMPYEDRLQQWLEPTRGERSETDARALALFGQLRALGFSGELPLGSASTSGAGGGSGAKAPKAAFIPLKFELGEAFQFDWSE